MTKRKFHRTVVEVEILSQEPVGGVDLETIHHQITEGDWSGHVCTKSVETLDGKQAADALKKQASDPCFFGLDDDGNDME